MRMSRSKNELQIRVLRGQWKPSVDCDFIDNTSVVFAFPECTLVVAGREHAT